MDKKQMTTEEWQAFKKRDALAALTTAINEDPKKYQELLQPPKPGGATWFRMSFYSFKTQDFSCIIVRNGDLVWTHFIADYFDRLDRPKIYKQLEGFKSPGTPAAAAALEFADHLSNLFRLYDMTDGLLASAPWSRAMYAAGESPAKYFLPVTVDGVEYIANEEIDEELRGKRKIATIDALVKAFPVKDRHLLREAFLHIANGGDGAAPQRQDGHHLTEEQIKQTLEVWQQHTDEEGCVLLDMSLRGYKRRLQIMRNKHVIFPKKATRQRESALSAQ